MLLIYYLLCKVISHIKIYTHIALRGYEYKICFWLDNVIMWLYKKVLINNYW